MSLDAPEEQNPVRQRLAHEAIALFAQKGYAATTVREIVAAAGVTKPVLYYYFGNKEGLYLEIMNKATLLLASVLHEAASRPGTASQRLLGLADRLFLLVSEHLPVLKLIHAIHYGPPQGAPYVDFEAIHLLLRETVRELVEQGMAQGEFAPGDMEHATWAIMGILHTGMEVQLCQACLALDRAGLAQVMQVLFRGLAAK